MVLASNLLSSPQMTLFRLLLTSALTVALGSLTGFAQSSQMNWGKSEPEIVVSTLHPPIYPEIARTASVGGEVEIRLGIRKDGSVDSAFPLSGPDLLRPAAIDSARQSRFECHGCTDEVTSYSLVYSFQFYTGEAPCNRRRTDVQFNPLQKRVVVTAERPEIVIDFSSFYVHSAKCLYLWACGIRWGGEDYYFERVRSAKCLYFWKCGLRRRVSVPQRTCSKTGLQFPDMPQRKIRHLAGQ